VGRAGIGLEGAGQAPEAAFDRVALAVTELLEEVAPNAVEMRAARRPEALETGPVSTAS